jgi:superfamily I DNA/RNA helicase
MRHIFESWPDDGGTRAILARTNAELLPAAATALEMGLPFRAPRLRFLSEDRRVDAILAAAAAVPAPGDSPLPRLVEVARSGLENIEATAPAEPAATAPAGAVAEDRDADEPLPVETADLVATLVGWAAPYRTLNEVAAALAQHRALIAELRRDDALLTLATAHSTKGLEFDHVAVVGLDAGRFPSARSLRDAPEPARALEEERRLAYVAWTRARRSLTLVYDPASPSPFLLEAFSDVELNLDAAPC